MPLGDRRGWRVVALALPLLYMGLIFMLSSIPGGAISVRVSDKLLHAVEYGGLSFLLYVAARVGLNKPAAWAAKWAVVISVLFGISDEWHQSFTPGREPSLLDLVADFIGAAGVQLILGAGRRLSLPLSRR